MIQAQKISTPFGNLQVKHAGEGGSMVCVHGILSSLESFVPIFDPIAKLRRVVAFDFPDHGHSQRGESFEPGWQGYVNVLRAAVDALEIETFDLCGHSMGGGVAALFAAQFPHRVKKLVLVDSVTAHFKLPLKGRIPQIPWLGDFVFKVLYGKNLFFDYFRNDVFFDASKIDHDRVTSFYEGFDGNRDVILRSVRATANPQPVVDSLSQIEAKTLIVWGRNDPLVPLFVGNETQRKIKRAQLRVLDNCGHSPMEESPNEAADFIAEFLSA